MRSFRQLRRNVAAAYLKKRKREIAQEPEYKGAMDDIESGRRVLMSLPFLQEQRAVSIEDAPILARQARQLIRRGEANLTNLAGPRVERNKARKTARKIAGKREGKKASPKWEDHIPRPKLE